MQSIKTERVQARDLGIAKMLEICAVIEPRMKALGFSTFDANDVRDAGRVDDAIRATLQQISELLHVDVKKIGKAIAAVLRRSPNLVENGPGSSGRCSKFAFRKEPAATPPAATELPAVVAGDSLTLLEAAIRGAAEAVIVEVRKLMAGGPKS